MIITNYHLRKFLLDKGIKTRFQRNLNKHTSKIDCKVQGMFFGKRQLEDLIRNAFTWKYTPEGYSFWKRIDHLWTDYVNNLEPRDFE